MLSSMHRICRLGNLSRTILQQNRFFVHHDGSELPRQYRHQWRPDEKEILYGKDRKKPIPKLDKHFFDPLQLPGYNQQTIADLYNQLMERKPQLSPQFVCILIHMFIKHQMMTPQIFDLIELQAYKHKGEYKIRSIFGGLKGSLLYNRQKLYNFFLGEYAASAYRFTFYQLFEILKALSNPNNGILKQIKQDLWENKFKQEFLDGLNSTRSLQSTMITRLIKLMNLFEEQDENIWKKLISLMKGKKGWSRVYMLQNLYELSGTYDEAQQLFDTYFQQLSQQDEILNFYNLTELRFHHPLELIKNAQENRQEYWPKIRTLVPEQYDPQQWNKKYQQFLQVGAVKQEAQMIRDKSKSLGFAIRERYQELHADGHDFMAMSKQEFQQMFGSFDQAKETIQTEDEKIVAAEAQREKQLQEEEQRKREEKESRKKNKK